MHDIRLAFRTLRRAPVLTAAAILSLALGIGANTAIFSVVDALLLRPLPVRDPQRLVTVSSGFALNHGFKAGAGMSYAIWSRMFERARMFENGFAWAPGRVDLSPGGEMQPANVLFTSGGFFSTLGVPALVGRTFTDADDVKGGGRDGLVAVIGYRLWQRQIGGAANVIGSRLRVDGVTCTIVGVMPPEFLGIEVGQPFDLVLPLATEPAIRGERASLHHPSRLMLTAMFRLKPDVSLEAATVALRAAQPDILGISDATPREIPAMLKDPYVLVPAGTGTSDRSGLRRQYGRSLLTLFAVVVLVLLVACVNVANLLLIRAAERRHEMAVRLAVGASRWRLARASIAESLILALVGAYLGLMFAMWASRALVASLSTADVEVSLALPVDWRVLLMTASTAVLTALLFGIGPAVTASRTAPIEVLTVRSAGADSRSRRWGVLLVLQVALSLVLLAAAGFLLSTLNRLLTVPLGFDVEQVLISEVDTARAHADQDSRFTYFQQLVTLVAAVPGVRHAAASTITPFSQATKSPLFADPARVTEVAVSPGYFATYGVALQSGRDFDQGDLPNAPRVVVVSELYARRYLTNREPLAATLDSGPCNRTAGICTVIGVVDDVVYGPLRSGPRATIYFPLAQASKVGAPGRTSIALSVRAAAGSPSSLAAAVGGVLTKADGRLSFSQRPLTRDVAAGLSQERLVAVLSGFFAALALLLSALGLYGVTAYSTARRRAEIGIRLALGSSRSQVIRLVLVRILGLTVIGLVGGVMISMWASRFIGALLFGVEPGDPSTLAGAVVLLGAVALVASFVPAFRASLSDPAQVLRET